MYRPAYPVSRAYFNNVNTTNTVINVTNVTNVYNSRDTTNVTYANQRVPGAVVAVPTTAFVQAQPVSRSALRLRPRRHRRSPPWRRRPSACAGPLRLATNLQPRRSTGR